MQRRNVKLLLQTVVIVVFVTTIVVYAYTKSRNLITGPSIVVTAPINGSVATSSAVFLQGLATNINSISLNDRPIFIDEEGNFTEIVLLGEGFNALRLNAKDRFGRETQQIVELIHSPTI